VRIAAAALLLTLVATVYPALQAARTQPAEALRYE
jgi:lipoprotein-releasing system permease protein